MKIFVKGLPNKYTQVNLKNHFQKYAPSVATVFYTKTAGKCGTLEFKDTENAKKAISEMNDTVIEGQRIVVTIKENRPQVVQSTSMADKPAHAVSQKQHHPSQRHGFRNKGKWPSKQQKGQAASNCKSGETFPYRFAKRPFTETKDIPPFHDCIGDNRFDIAFDIEWTALTPTAANPCDDPAEKASMPENDDNEYSGYNRRWLTIDDRLAISPFTVKSAIANAVANLLGSCIRVQSKPVSHQISSGGQYPYNGQYKRYRVDMGGRSEPGFLKTITQVNGGRKVEIQPAREFYYQHNLPKTLAGLKPGDTVFAVAQQRQGRPVEQHKPWLIEKGKISLQKNDQSVFDSRDRVVPLKYHGPYGYGVDMMQAGKNHKHRFYQEKTDKQGKPEKLQTGIIPEINFAQDPGEMEKFVYMGQYRDDPARYPGKTWFQSIHDLQGGNPGDWVYYEVFDGKVTNIGRSFLFKALFLHEDTVPEGQAECKDMEQLCPRCAIFGMTDESGKKGRPAVGYGGRFKAAALISDQAIRVDENDPADSVPIPYLNGKNNNRNVDMKKWKAGNDIICRQFLLPIQGAPKPNKRDVRGGGYFDPESGAIKGVKNYLHAALTMDKLENHIKEIITAYVNPETLLEKGQFKYSHKLRNYAQVCREGIVFRGTVGLENASVEEAAALVMCLDSRVGGHGFKIGLGKAFGLGSMKSKISRVWIRQPDIYQWAQENISNTETMTLEKFTSRLKASEQQKFRELAFALAKFTNIEEMLNLINGMDRRVLEFPQVRGYWKTAQRTGLK